MNRLVKLSNKKSLIKKCSIFSLLLILLIIACSTDSSPSATTTSNSHGSKYGGQGVAYGIKETQEGRYWRTYQVTAGIPFRGFFRLLNQRPAENYLLTCLVDYRQAPCTFYGHQQLLYPLSMGDFEDHSVPFETPPLPPGLHDLALLAFAKPDVHDLSREYRFSTDFNYLYAPRAVLLSGDEPWTTPLTEPVIVGREPVSRTIRLNGIVVNREDKRLQAWLIQEAESGEIIEYYVHMGNDTGPSRTFAIMAFLDYRQIPLDGAEQWVAYVSLPTGTRVTLPGRLTAPQETGVHEFMIVQAYDPYQMLEDFPHTPNTSLTQFSDIVESSIRVAIVTEE